MEFIAISVLGVLLCRLGLSIYSTGLVRSKNAVSTMGRHMLEIAVSVLAYWLIGAAVETFEWRAIGSSPILPSTLIVGAIIVGATAERASVWPMVLLSAVFNGLVVPLINRGVLNGWLGFSMLSGAAAWHVAGAAAALAAVRSVGPRDGKYHRDGSASMIPGHNLSNAMTGALIALAGFAIMQGGAPVLPILAAAAAAVTAAVYGQVQFGKIDLSVVTMSLLAGAVAMTCAGPSMPQWAVVLIGAATGLITPLALIKIDLVGRIDDVTGAITVHGIAGVWGAMATALFSRATMLSPDPGWFTRPKQLLLQLIGLAVMIGVSYGFAWTTLKLLGKTMKLRATDADEFDGLDLAEHDVGAYPDFQQNTIKSYHLREA